MPSSTVTSGNNAPPLPAGHHRVSQLERDAEQFIEHHKDEFTPREAAAIASTFVVPWTKVAETNEVVLPGFGVFLWTSAYDPTDMGDVGRYPAKVRVLVPVSPYPRMQFVAQRALGARYAVAVELEQQERLKTAQELHAMEVEHIRDFQRQLNKKLDSFAIPPEMLAQAPLRPSSGGFTGLHHQPQMANKPKRPSLLDVFKK